MNILSIDIDYAFSPTICDYDDYIEGSRISLAEQNEINRKLNLPRPKVNQNTIEYLRQVIQDKTTSLTPITSSSDYGTPTVRSIYDYQL